MSLTQTASYQSTMRVSFLSYMVQAVINHFAPLLFLTWQRSFGIPLHQITLLITCNFCIQLLTDLVSPRIVSRLGTRGTMVFAHLCAAAGLIGLTVLPGILPFPGLLLSTGICAVGGGLLEVLVSPIVEACPTDHKESAMSLLHSFYCWGFVMVVLGSTAFFTFFGMERWPILAVIWALFTLCNGWAWTRVPLFPLPGGQQGLNLAQLGRRPLFWLLVLLMVCAGASEQAVSQWSSAFAEAGLQVDKAVGDLCGPMLFALCMGTARLLYGKWGEHLALGKAMAGSAGLCIASYLLMIFSPWPALGLAGCGLCGFSVGILWPGTFSIAARAIPQGGTVLFAMLAVGGDLGCTLGPTVAGMTSTLMQDDLRWGLLAAALFPIGMLVGSLLLRRRRIA